MKGPTLTASERAVVLEDKPRAGVLQGQVDEVAAGMQGLCEAISRLSRVRGALSKALRRQPVGGRAEEVALAMARACDHLVQAVADLPDECWAALLADQMITADQVAAALGKARG